MEAPDMQGAAASVFLASGDGPGPIAVKITRRVRGGMAMITLECLRSPSQLKASGVFSILVDRLDLFEPDTFVDFGDIEALHNHLADLAGRGLALCQATPGGDGAAAPEQLLEVVADAVVWRLTIRRKAIPTAAEVLAELAKDRPRQGLDLQAIVSAAAFGRLATVSATSRWIGACRSYLAEVAEQARTWRQAWLKGLQAPHREALARLQETEKKLTSAREQTTILEGGSLNSNWRYLQNRVELLTSEVEELRETERRAQRACQLAVMTAAGSERARLYGTPSPAPAPGVNEAPPAA